jgi:uncharacterized protein (DUF1778 family)
MFKSGNKVRINDSVLRKVRIAAEILGCTVEEFVSQAAEREAEKALSLMPRRDQISSSDIDGSIEQQENA